MGDSPLSHTKDPSPYAKLQTIPSRERRKLVECASCGLERSACGVGTGSGALQEFRPMFEWVNTRSFRHLVTYSLVDIGPNVTRCYINLEVMRFSGRSSVKLLQMSSHVGARVEPQASTWLAKLPINLICPFFT